MLSFSSVQSYFESLQERLIHTVESLEPTHRFFKDAWSHASAEAGGGLSCVLEDGVVFEKAGVNFSRVRGAALPSSATARLPDLAGLPFEAMGVSLVFHPRNPFVPTTHMNVRCIQVERPNQAPVRWFGGGFDLTPYYPFEEDVRHWHQIAYQACQPFGSDVYEEFKSWCDRYFFLKHRNETRGVGGLFFDDLRRWDDSTCFNFVKSVGDHFLLAYFPIVERRKDLPYSDRHRDFQNYRRGRYVEFNLLYDRGTLFGLQSNGRTESILMSMPPIARWIYQWSPEESSEESNLYKHYLKARDWLGLSHKNIR